MRTTEIRVADIKRVVLALDNLQQELRVSNLIYYTALSLSADALKKIEGIDELFVVEGLENL